MSSGPQRGASDDGGSSDRHQRRSTKRRSSAQRPDHDHRDHRAALASSEPMSTTKRSNSYQLPPLNWELAAAVAQARVNELRLQLEAPIPLPAVADASRQDSSSRGHTQPEARRFALPAPPPSSPEVVVVDGTGAAEAVDTAEDDVLLLLSSGTQPPISSQGQASYAESGIVFSSDTRPRQSPFVVASHADEEMPSVSGSAFTASSQHTDEPPSSSSSWNLFRRNDYSYNDHGLGDRVFDQAAQEAESERQVQKLRRELQERSRNEPRLGASMLRLVDRFIAMSRGPIGPSQQLVRALDLCPCYASVALRVHTFKYRPWPVELADLALSLVDAGFFYRGVDDLVTCYSCYGSLRNWQPYSNPWVQHALAFPRCLHVLRVRGRSFPCTEWTFLLEDIRRQPSRWSAIDPEYMFRRDRRGYATETFDTIPLPPRYGGYRDPREDGGSNSSRPRRPSASSSSSNQPDASSIPSQPQQQHYQPSMPRRRPSHPVPTVFGSMHEGLRVPEPPVTPAPTSPATAYVADSRGGDILGSPIVVRFATESEYRDSQRLQLQQQQQQQQRQSSTAFANVTPYQQQQQQIVQVRVPQPLPQQQPQQQPPTHSMLPSPIVVPRAPTPSATTIAESDAATSSRILSQPQQQPPPPPPQPRVADNTKLCIICCENEVELAFVPCGHAITCRACSVEMFDCCYCRQEIHDRLRIYLL